MWLLISSCPHQNLWSCAVAAKLYTRYHLAGNPSFSGVWTPSINHSSTGQTCTWPHLKYSFHQNRNNSRFAVHSMMSLSGSCNIPISGCLILTNSATNQVNCRRNSKKASEKKWAFITSPCYWETIPSHFSPK